MANELTEAEWDDVQADLNEHISDFRGVYEDPDSHQEVRKETDEYLILADSSGQEYSEIADIVGVDRDALSQRMHKEARKRYDGRGNGDPWSVADPVVIIKEE